MESTQGNERSCIIFMVSCFYWSNHSAITNNFCGCVYPVDFDGPLFSDPNIIWNSMPRSCEKSGLHRSHLLSMRSSCCDIQNFSVWTEFTQQADLFLLNFGFSTSNCYCFLYRKESGSHILENIFLMRGDWKPSHLSEIAWHTGLTHLVWTRRWTLDNRYPVLTYPLTLGVWNFIFDWFCSRVLAWFVSAWKTAGTQMQMPE